MNTIELRWLMRNEPYMNFLTNTVKVLQYRQLLTQQWTEWKDVPIVEEKE